MLTLITNNLDLLLTVYLIGIPVFMALLMIASKLYNQIPNSDMIIVNSAIWPLNVVYVTIGAIFDVLFYFFRR